MSQKLRSLCVAGALAAIAILSSPAYAQFPQGPPLPVSGVHKDELHSSFRLGYIANNQYYKYDGQFMADGDLFVKGKDAVYAFGNITIQSRLINKSVLQPDRLWGTFEAGDRHAVSRHAVVEVFMRHQSAHSIDNTAGPESLYEMAGLRYRTTSGRSTVTVGAAYITRTALLDYGSDGQIHVTYDAGSLGRRKLTVDVDVHGVTETGGGRSGFVDCSIEPSLALSDKISTFVTLSTLHDADKPNGKTENIVMIGLKAAT